MTLSKDSVFSRDHETPAVRDKRADTKDGKFDRQPFNILVFPTTDELIENNLNHPIFCFTLWNASIELDRNDYQKWLYTPGLEFSGCKKMGEKTTTQKVIPFNSRGPKNPQRIFHTLQRVQAPNTNSQKEKRNKKKKFLMQIDRLAL